MLIGILAYSFAVGALSSFLLNQDTAESVLEEKINYAIEFCKEALVKKNIKR